MKKSLEELRQELANTTSFVEDLAAKDRERGLSDEEQEQFEVGMTEAEDIREQVAAREKRAAMAQNIAAIGSSLGDGKETEDENDGQYRDVIAKFVRSERFQAIARTKNRPGGWRVGAVEFNADSDVTTDNPAADLLQGTLRPGIVTPFVYPARVGGLFAQATMEGSNIPWLSFDGDAGADVRDVNTQKPSGSGEVALNSSRAIKVPATYTIPEEALDDLPALEGTLRNMLLNGKGGVGKKFENQYINGAGSGSGEIDGILQLSPTDNTIPGERTSKSILFASLEVDRVSGFPADAVVMNPADAFVLMTEEDDNSRPLWGAFGAFYQLPSGPARFVTSNAVAQGTIIVGAFGSSILYTRRATSIRASSEGIGLADKNLVLFVAEGRQALVHPYGKDTYRTVTVETVSS